jgi:hypothetical protein
MPTWALIVIVLVVVAVAAMATTAAMRQRRSAALQNRFGPEYKRTLETREDQRAAESELRDRQRRRAKLDIKPLPEASRIRYAEEWRTVQEHFVDQPGEAVSQADALLHQVMAERGYPVGDFAAQSDLISVDHPAVVENYRVAHAIRDRMDTGQVSTEELREALLRYRSLFDDLLRADQGSTEQDSADRRDADQDHADQGDTVQGDTVRTRATKTDVSTADVHARHDDAGDGPGGSAPGTVTVPAQPAADSAPMEADDDTR